MSGAAEALLRIAAGGSPVLTKPFSMIELARAVKSVLAARQAA
jgi:DNA-binding response OmpR family regulator